MRILRLSLVLAVFLTNEAIAQSKQEQAYAIPAMDAPSLARLGPYEIGTQSIEIHSQRSVRLTINGVSRSAHTIKSRIWYPAKPSPDQVRTSFTHTLPKLDGGAIKFAISSIAVDNAAVSQGRRFPLIVVSHGYNGWDTFMTWLTENLASKGYVVVAIDHEDQRATLGPEFAVSFGNVLTNRAADQRTVIDYFVSRAADKRDMLGAIVDTENVGLVGYSMGGFGALATAGMDYDPASVLFTQLPAEARAAVFESQAQGSAVAKRVKAVVALAPFGGRPASRAWTANAVAKFDKPILMIDGSEDDIVNAKQGVAWIFDQMESNDRHFLLFQHARHNVGGNPPPVETDNDFSIREYFAEPVWRTERINAINQHFITAFFDLNLKGDRSMSPYLNVAPAVAGDGQWPLAEFENAGGRTASENEPGYWRGFQRRWALGLEMTIGRPGKIH